MKSLFILLILFSFSIEYYEGKNLRVIDGDTFVLQTEEGILDLVRWEG